MIELTVPEVTVILVTYNRADTLDAVIKDISEQSFRDFRLVICDDGSPDTTQAICEAWSVADNRIVYIRRKANMGMPGNLNAALAETLSPYIAIVHDGNRYDSQALELWLQALIDCPSAAFAFSQIAVVNQVGTHVSTFREPYAGPVSGRSLLRRVFFRRWRFDSPVFGIAMIRRAALDNFGLLNPEFGFYADVDLWMGLLHEWDATYVDRPLVRIVPRELQPHQFYYNPWELADMMHRMFGRHRGVEFASDRRYRRVYESWLHHWYCMRDDVFRLLLFYRRGEFASILEGRRHFVTEALPLFPLWWLVVKLRRVRPLLLPAATRRFS